MLGKLYKLCQKFVVALFKVSEFPGTDCYLFGQFQSISPVQFGIFFSKSCGFLNSSSPVVWRRKILQQVMLDSCQSNRIKQTGGCTWFIDAYKQPETDLDSRSAKNI